MPNEKNVGNTEIANPSYDRRIGNPSYILKLYRLFLRGRNGQIIRAA